MTIIRCGFCHETTDTPSLLGWFRVKNGTTTYFCSGWHWLRFMPVLWKERSR